MPIIPVWFGYLLDPLHFIIKGDHIYSIYFFCFVFYFKKEKKKNLNKNKNDDDDDDDGISSPTQLGVCVLCVCDVECLFSSPHINRPFEKRPAAKCTRRVI